MLHNPIADFLPANEASRNFRQNLEFQERFESELADGFTNRIRHSIIDIGIPPRLQKAELLSIPNEISSLKCFSAFPSRNYGIVGPGGCGKSCSIAWAIKKTLRQEFEEAGPSKIIERIPEPGMVHTKPFQGTVQVNASAKTSFKWVGWPAFVVRMKQMASRRMWEDRDASVSGLVNWVCADPENRVLILDDIGMEIVKPEAYTTEQLELLIDEIYNHEGRLIWTSNKTPEELEKPEAYGYRLVSRLTGLAPDVQLPHNMPDLRVRAIG